MSDPRGPLVPRFAAGKPLWKSLDVRNDPWLDTCMENTEATTKRDEARKLLNSLKFGTKAWREAEEDLNFWIGRVAMTPPGWEFKGSAHQRISQ